VREREWPLLLFLLPILDHAALGRVGEDAADSGLQFADPQGEAAAASKRRAIIDTVSASLLPPGFFEEKFILVIRTPDEFQHSIGGWRPIIYVVGVEREECISPDREDVGMLCRTWEQMTPLPSSCASVLSPHSPSR
jgi:hypothetical protein